MASLPARINLVTLGVADLQQSSAFYERLGWRRKARALEADVRFFALDNIVLGLFSRASLAADAGVRDSPAGFGGVTLAINLPSEAEVDRAFRLALDCGARAVKPPVAAEWGGYSGYFADPDNHLWELAYNPFFPLREGGEMELPD